MKQANKHDSISNEMRIKHAQQAMKCEMKHASGAADMRSLRILKPAG